jgi:hypothetical protein
MLKVVLFLGAPRLQNSVHGILRWEAATKFETLVPILAGAQR